MTADALPDAPIIEFARPSMTGSPQDSAVYNGKRPGVTPGLEVRADATRVGQEQPTPSPTPPHHAAGEAHPDAPTIEFAPLDPALLDVPATDFARPAPVSPNAPTMEFARPAFGFQDAPTLEFALPFFAGSPQDSGVDNGKGPGAAAGREEAASGLWQKLWRKLHPMAFRIGWGLADQAISSLTNVAVSIYIVHALGVVQFGAFSLAYVTYGFALNASRGIATEPLMIRFSATDVPTWRRAVANCTGTALVMGLVLGIAVMVAAAIMHGTTRYAFLALGLTLPGLMLQDSWRYSFFALGRGSQAFLNDLIWLATLAPALLLLRTTGHANVFWYVLAWGATATVAAAVGPLQARVMPKLAGAREWLSHHRDLGPRYLIEGTSSSVSMQLRAYGVSLILGLAAVGYIQTAATLMGPVTILFLGMSLVTIPEAARILQRSPRHLPLFCLLVSAGLAAAALCWGLVLLVAVPRGLGAWLLGPAWRPAYPLLLPTALWVVGGGFSAGAFAGMHALGAAQRSLNVALLGNVAIVVGALVGGALGGAAGTVRGIIIPAWLGALLLWWQFRVALRESGHASSDSRWFSIRRSARHRRPGAGYRSGESAPKSGAGPADSSRTALPASLPSAPEAELIPGFRS